MTDLLDLFNSERKSAAERMRINRPIILSALKHLGITHVRIEYSGSGDCGQVDDISFYKGEDPLKTVRDKIHVHCEKAHWNEDNSKWDKKTFTQELPLNKAIEDFVYHWLESAHPGWEINEGSSGDCTFDVEIDKIFFRHTEYIMESETTEHEE